jgi:uncharacterized membrane protein
MEQVAKRTEQTDVLAMGLGWFSVGLGLAELTAPRSLARLIGIRRDDDAMSTLRAFGAREVANGIAILSEPNRPAWMWGRVAGDAIDLLSLLQAGKVDARKTSAAAAAVLGVAAVDLYCAQRLAGDGHAVSRRRGGTAQVHLTEAITVNRSIEDVYAFWRDFENFPRFMRHIEEVRVSGTRSHWRVSGPAGASVEWDAELTEERQHERLSWRTVEPAEVAHHGSVRFRRAPRSSGTEIWVNLYYSPPAGRMGRGIAWLLGSDPESQVREDLRRFKQLMETGEIVVSDGPAMWRPARPAQRSESQKSGFESPRTTGVRS